LTKVREQARFHLRRKRGLDHEVEPGAAGPEGSPSVWHPADPGPSPAETAGFADQFSQLLGTMDEEERQVVDLKLQDCTNEEIAERLACSERTVRRLLKRVQSQLAGAFEVA
jgi:RNA polymerase sigma factor (sigma-70 family)